MNCSGKCSVPIPKNVCRPGPNPSLRAMARRSPRPLTNRMPRTRRSGSAGAPPQPHINRKHLPGQRLPLRSRSASKRPLWCLATGARGGRLGLAARLTVDAPNGGLGAYAAAADAQRGLGASLLVDLRRNSKVKLGLVSRHLRVLTFSSTRSWPVTGPDTFFFLSNTLRPRRWPRIALH